MTVKFHERTVREIPHIEKPAIEFAESRGWYQCKITSPSKRGIPDRFLARRGRIILVEFKRPGKEPTAQQAVRHKELRDHGVEVHWINNLRDAYDLLR